MSADTRKCHNHGAQPLPHIPTPNQEAPKEEGMRQTITKQNDADANFNQHANKDVLQQRLTA